MYPCECTGPTGNGIKYSYIDSCGNLIFIYDNNFTNNVGNLLGPTGITGPNGYTGPTGPTGNGIDFVYLDSCCNLITVMTNGNVINAGKYNCCNQITGCTGSGSCDVETIIYSGPNQPPLTPTWPNNTTPVPILPPLAGNVYICNITGCLYIFNGESWVTCVGQNDNYYGINTPTGINWPVGTTPVPTPIYPMDGNVYINELNGNMYFYKNLTNTWENFHSGNFVTYRGSGALVHFKPSIANQMYATEIVTDISLTNAFTKQMTNSGSDVNNINDYWPPPINSTYFVCNTRGVYNLTFGFDYNEFTPSSINNTGNMVMYILDSSNNYTRQYCMVGQNSTVILDIDYKIIIYTLTDNIMDNLLTFDSINLNAFFEFTRKY